jgi:hypothetical protein
MNTRPNGMNTCPNGMNIRPNGMNTRPELASSFIRMDGGGDRTSATSGANTRVADTGAVGIGRNGNKNGKRL